MGTNTNGHAGGGTGATRSVLDSLRRLVRELRVFSRRAETSAGLTAAQLFVLERLAEHQPLTVNELAERTFTHQSSVSVVVSKLHTRGLVARRQGEDGRQRQLSITAAGRGALERAPRSVQDRLLDAAASLKPADLRRLAQLLRELVEAAGLERGEPALFFEPEQRERRPSSLRGHKPGTAGRKPRRGKDRRR